jgi:hypothetical protein
MHYAVQRILSKHLLFQLELTWDFFVGDRPDVRCTKGGERSTARICPCGEYCVEFLFY